MADPYPSAAAPAVVYAAHEPVTLVAGAQPLLDRYEELRPTVNHSAAVLHWASQFTPIPGNVRFHSWTLYEHFLVPVTDSVVHNFAAVIDDGIPLDHALSAVSADTIQAFGDFVTAELSGHTNVVPPTGNPSDSVGGADPWAYWAIEVVAAPLYYLPVAPALIVQVPIAARLAVDVAGVAVAEVAGVIDSASTPQQALTAVGDYLRREAVPGWIGAQQELLTPPEAPTSATADPEPEPAERLLTTSSPPDDSEASTTSAIEAAKPGPSNSRYRATLDRATLDRTMLDRKARSPRISGAVERLRERAGAVRSHSSSPRVSAGATATTGD